MRQKVQCPSFILKKAKVVKDQYCMESSVRLSQFEETKGKLKGFESESKCQCESQTQASRKGSDSNKSIPCESTGLPANGIMGSNCEFVRLSFMGRRQEHMVQTKIRKRSTSQQDAETTSVEQFQQQRENISFRISFSAQDFEFIKVLGTGVAGKVCLVRQRQAKMLFALKAITKRRIKENKLQDLIIQEIKVGVLLDHRNLTKFYGFFSDQKHFYIIQQYAGEETLYSLLGNQAKLKEISEKRVAHYIRQICKGVSAMHRNGILHRDLKLENIVVREGLLKICDFGCAVNLSNNGLQQTQVGSLPYMTPEEIKGEKYGKEKDIWSIGVMTYELLFQQTPFREEKLLEVFNGINGSQEFPALEFPKYRKISPAAQDFLVKVLESDRRIRLTMDQMLGHQFLNQ